MSRTQSYKSEVQPTAAQLLSVIEFSRKFPELTQHLAVTLNAGEKQYNAIQNKSSEELLEFPQLISLDPREIRSRLSDKEVTEQPDTLDELALFAAGCLPPPEPLMRQSNQEKNKKIWALLLPLTLFFLFFLFWLNEIVTPVSPMSNANNNLAEDKPLTLSVP